MLEYHQDGDSSKSETGPGKWFNGKTYVCLNIILKKKERKRNRALRRKKKDVPTPAWGMDRSEVSLPLLRSLTSLASSDFFWS